MAAVTGQPITIGFDSRFLPRIWIFINHDGLFLAIWRSGFRVLGSKLSCHILLGLKACRAWQVMGWRFLFTRFAWYVNFAGLIWWRIFRCCPSFYQLGHKTGMMWNFGEQGGLEKSSSITSYVQDKHWFYWFKDLCLELNIMLSQLDLN